MFTGGRAAGAAMAAAIIVVAGSHYVGQGSVSVVPPSVFITTTGSDAAACTAAAPCLTLGRGYAVASPGNLVQVAAGTYAAQTICKDGALCASLVATKGGAPVTFKASGTVTIGGDLTLGTNGGTAGGSPSDLVFDGLVVHGALRQFGYTGVSNITVKNGQVWDLTDAGGGTLGYPLVKTDAVSSMTIQNMEIGPACCGADGIGSSVRLAASVASNLVVKDSYIHDLYDACKYVPAAIVAAYETCDGAGYGDSAASPPATTTTLNGGIDASTGTIVVASSTNFPPTSDFYATIDSEIILVTSISGTTWTATRAQKSTTGATHSSGATVTVYNDGYDHVDGIHVYGGLLGLTIQRNRFYSIGVNGDPVGQSIFIESGDVNAVGSGPGCTPVGENVYVSNLLVENNMVYGVPNNAVSAGDHYCGNDGLGGTSGFVKFLYNSVYTTTGAGNLAIGGVATTATVTIAGNILKRLDTHTGSTNLSCRIQDYPTTGFLTPVTKNNIYTNVASPLTGSDKCDATDTRGTPVFVSTTETAPNLHLSGAQTAVNGGEATYCPATDFDSQVRPVGGTCDIGADETG